MKVNKKEWNCIVDAIEKTIAVCEAVEIKKRESPENLHLTSEHDQEWQGKRNWNLQHL
ncbi:MAG: hypothetical protein MJZ00_01275 [Paludibacteraceae bacterium]|nr:hypothetical protein [Paludibacteraceae bacterium]